MSARVPVIEWRDFLLQIPQWSKPILYAESVPDFDVLQEDTLQFKTLNAFATLPRLSVDKLRAAAAFVAADESPRMATRFSKATKDALRAGRLTLADAAFVCAYMHVFCSGLMMEQVYKPSDDDTAVDERGAMGMFAARPTDLTFVLEAATNEGIQCLVLIKHDQKHPHKLVVLLYEITRERYNSSASPEKRSRLRINGVRYDPSTGTADEPDAELRSVYKIDDPERISPGDIVYELVRNLYSHYHGWHNQQIEFDDIIEVFDDIVADHMHTEALRAAWFCTTVEWLGQERIASALENNLLFGNVVHYVRNQFERAANQKNVRPPRIPNAVRPLRATPDRREIVATARIRLFNDVQQALGNLFVSSAIVYHWCTALTTTFWSAADKHLWEVLDSQSGVQPHEDNVDYFDTPYTPAAKVLMPNFQAPALKTPSPQSKQAPANNSNLAIKKEKQPSPENPVPESVLRAIVIDDSRTNSPIAFDDIPFAPDIKPSDSQSSLEPTIRVPKTPIDVGDSDSTSLLPITFRKPLAGNQITTSSDDEDGGSDGVVQLNKRLRSKARVKNI